MGKVTRNRDVRVIFTPRSFLRPLFVFAFLSPSIFFWQFWLVGCGKRNGKEKGREFNFPGCQKKRQFACDARSRDLFSFLSLGQKRNMKRRSRNQRERRGKNPFPNECFSRSHLVFIFLRCQPLRGHSREFPRSALDMTSTQFVPLSPERNHSKNE